MKLAADDDVFGLTEEAWLEAVEEMAKSSKRLRAARNELDERAALIDWLNSSRKVLAGLFNRHVAEPAILLQAALEHLDGGTTPDLLRPAAVIKRTFPTWEKARARAVLAVEEMVRVGIKAGTATEVVAEVSGMDIGALGRLRKAVKAGSQKGVRAAMEHERMGLVSAMSKARQGPNPLGVAYALTSILFDDKLIHRHLRKRPSRVSR